MSSLIKRIVTIVITCLSVTSCIAMDDPNLTPPGGARGERRLGPGAATRLAALLFGDDFNGDDAGIPVAPPRDPMELHRAVAEGNHNAMRRLLGRFVDTDVTDDNGQTPLTLAVTGQDIMAVRLLLGDDPNAAADAVAVSADVNRVGANGMSPLEIAAFNGNNEILRILLRAGASRLASAFSQAMQSSHHEAARLLILYGAQATEEQKNICGLTDAEKALIGGNDEQFGQLLENDEVVLNVNQLRDLLEGAVSRGQAGMLNAILEIYDVDVEFLRDLLMLAIERVQPEAFAVLIRHYQGGMAPLRYLERLLTRKLTTGESLGVAQRTALIRQIRPMLMAGQGRALQQLPRPQLDPAPQLMNDRARGGRLLLGGFVLDDSGIF